MANKCYILNFDDSVTRQKKLLSRYDPVIVDLKDMAPSVRFWMDQRTRRRLEGSISHLPKDALFFTGSGDFHHVSSLLIGRFDDPVTVINFDRHPDWDTLSPVLTCGSWVRDAMRHRRVRKMILAGMGSAGMLPSLPQTGCMDELRHDRLEVYPYRLAPSYVFFKKVPDNISIEVKRYGPVSRVTWNCLNEKNLYEFFLHIVNRIPTEGVYISIDKDCLKKKHALTNWEEGFMEMEELLMMLKILKDNRKVLAVDITGEYSNPEVYGTLKKIVSRVNHPRVPSALSSPCAGIDETNESANLTILEHISS